MSRNTESQDADLVQMRSGGLQTISAKGEKALEDKGCWLGAGEHRAGGEGF